MDEFTSASACVETADDFAVASPRRDDPARDARAPEIPDYLQDTYYWAYINPRNVRLLDREIVVRTILWQQHNRLQRLAFAEIEPGQRVMQPASVYGSFGLAQYRVGAARRQAATCSTVVCTPGAPLSGRGGQPGGRDAATRLLRENRAITRS